MSLKENTLSEMVGHERRQDLIGVLASLPDAIGGALQRLSVRQCVHHCLLLTIKKNTLQL
jgi:hypothetical protein